MKNTFVLLITLVISISACLPALSQDSLYQLSKPRATPKPSYLRTPSLKNLYKSPYPKNDYLKNNLYKDTYKSPYPKLDGYSNPTRSSRASKLKPGQGTISINSATTDELVRLPGIGPKTATSILEYRHTHGAFVSIDDLMEVKGIGKKTLEKLRQFITL